jgi:hypothetical protein
MPTVVQFRRGTTAQNNAFTGAAGEISVDTTLGTIRVHNGTVGGNILASIDAVQTLSNKTLATPTVTGTLTSTGLINTSGNISAAILNSGAINSTGLINTTGNIVCASISAGTYVGLSSNKINTNASNVTVDTSWVNVAVNGSNVAALGAASQLNLLSTAATSSSTGALVVTGGVGIGGSLFVGSGLTVAGNLTINGNLTTINSNNLTVNDSIIYLAEENPADTLDIGITAHVVNPTLNHVGFVRDATDSTWKLFANVATQPSGTVDFTNATWSTLQTGNHVPGSSNVFTLGSTTAWWQKAFTVSATAQYADLAENYTSDSDYAPGTVLVFGGEAEVTQSATSHDTRIAGVVSTNPAYLMNGAEPGIAVALQGRVPCRVLGPVAKGDRLVASQHPGIAQKLNPDLYEPGCIIGKALQAIDSTDISIIEVVVGRL